MIKPQTVDVEMADGTSKQFVLSRLPATRGRELVFQYPTSGLPKIGDYELNQKLMFKLMGYCAVVLPNGESLPLTSEALINNHLESWEDLVKLEGLMISYNCSFFRQRQGLEFLRSYRPEISGVDYRNVDPVIGTIIDERLATRRELDTIYDLEDALDFFEIIMVRRYNEYLAVEHAKRKK